MAVPSHLIEIAVRTSETWDPLTAGIKCQCGNTCFKLLSDCGRHSTIVHACCTNCEKEHCIIDRDFHGWEGYVCHDRQSASRPRPALDMCRCEACGCLAHEISVRISPEKEQFLELAPKIDGIEPSRWADAFGSIEIETVCAECSNRLTPWICIETA